MSPWPCGSQRRNESVAVVRRTMGRLLSGRRGDRPRDRLRLAGAQRAAQRVERAHLGQAVVGRDAVRLAGPQAVAEMLELGRELEGRLEVEAARLAGGVGQLEAGRLVLVVPGPVDAQARPRAEDLDGLARR